MEALNECTVMHVDRERFEGRTSLHQRYRPQKVVFAIPRQIHFPEVKTAREGRQLRRDGPQLPRHIQLRRPRKRRRTQLFGDSRLFVKAFLVGTPWNIENEYREVLKKRERRSTVAARKKSGMGSALAPTSDHPIFPLSHPWFVRCGSSGLVRTR